MGDLRLALASRPPLPPPHGAHRGASENNNSRLGEATGEGTGIPEWKWSDPPPQACPRFSTAPSAARQSETDRKQKQQAQRRWVHPLQHRNVMRNHPPVENGLSAEGEAVDGRALAFR